MSRLNKFMLILRRLGWLLLFLVFGIMLTNQYLIYTKIGSIKSAQDPQMIAVRVSQLYFDNAKLKEQLDERTAHKTDLENAATNNLETQRILQKEKEKYEVILGMTQVSGPGVIITIDHMLVTTQLVDFIDALRNSGAEAMAINEKRILTNTPMNQFDQQPNFVIKVIGDKDVLYDSLTRPGGILDLISNGKVERQDGIALPKAS